ncbi:CPBP family intramembrane glutamic endopeptidase [Nonlabens ulvanivorans]|uniref:CPBP family intramembrane glutamic endopeptidase n=1 Tax=Nonlabens ulvanivorans TaxID=906888 RepID=UPI0029430EAE|nr:CPBP family intramembrane glutamic endopeptidase [Nonlabens ulvanivorans]WOI24167.1 CPBP family intramembrane glutamic endopeptidase [Nonlabens ulvanivorans]
MYIEQGYKGNLGVWNFFLIPVGFMLFMVFNYFSTQMLVEEQGQSVEEIMAQMIEMMGKMPFLIVNLLTFVVGLVSIFVWVKYIHQQSITSLTTSRKKIDWKRIGFMFLFWATISVATMLLSVYSAPENFEYNLNWSKFIPLVVVSFLLFPFQTSFEEYLFRGQLLQGLGILTKTRWVPFILTSVLFGVMHAANPEVEKLGMEVMVFYIGTGLLLGAMTLMDEGLELALGFHAANNITAALMVTSTWTAIQTDSVFLDVSQPSFGLADMLPIVIGYPIILWILAKIYKWSNWKEKLFGKVLSKEEFDNLNAS